MRTLKIYTKAVKLLTERGYSVAEVATRLDVAAHSL